MAPSRLPATICPSPRPRSSGRCSSSASRWGHRRCRWRLRRSAAMACRRAHGLRCCDSSRPRRGRSRTTSGGCPWTRRCCWSGQRAEAVRMGARSAAAARRFSGSWARKRRWARASGCWSTSSSTPASPTCSAWGSTGPKRGCPLTSSPWPGPARASSRPRRCGGTWSRACRGERRSRAGRGWIALRPGAAPTGAARCSGCSRTCASASRPVVAARWKMRCAG